MKIEKLIKIFEQILPYYQKAIDENFTYYDIRRSHLEFGLCHFAYTYLNEYINPVFLNYYYELLRNDGFLFKSPFDNYSSEGIQERIDFMKSEIKSLNKLLKQGYTDV